jgi:hypothetical protein
MLAVGGRVMPTRAWRLGGPLAWSMAVTGIAWSVRGRSRSVRGWMPRRGEGGVERPRRAAAFLADLRSSPTAAATWSLTWLPPKVIGPGLG